MTTEGEVTNSRAKGNRGELAACEALAPWGRTWRRRVGQSQQGVVKPPDLVMVDPPSEWHASQGPEVKYGASVNLRAAWAQAVRESGDGPRVPWVLARRVSADRRGRRAEGWVLACEVIDWDTVWSCMTGLSESTAPELELSSPARLTSTPIRSLATGATCQRWPDEESAMVVLWLDDVPRPAGVSL
jgi:hypothetical protein